MLARAPVYTAVVVATLALGIGANTAISSLVVATVLRSAPYGEAERLVAVWTHWIGSSNLRSPSSCPDLLDWRDHSEIFEEYGYFFPRRTYNMGGSDLEPQQVLGGRMSASLLPMLRVSPVLGRSFLPEEDVEGARTVVMLTHGFWRQQFGGDPDIIGKSVRLDQVPYEIVGVLPEEFHIESPAPKLWVPFSQEGAVESFGRQVSWLNVIGRLNPGISVGQAAAALEIISASRGWPRPPCADSACAAARLRTSRRSSPACPCSAAPNWATPSASTCAGRPLAAATASSWRCVCWRNSNGSRSWPCPPAKAPDGAAKRPSRRASASAPQAPLEGPLPQLEPLRLRLVSDRAEAALWNEFLTRYHPLGLSLRQLAADWQRIHGVLPVLVETYVSDQHKGTCYRASNWHCLGHTQVRGAWGTAPAKTPKAVFVYPLRRDWQTVLLGPTHPVRSR